MPESLRDNPMPVELSRRVMVAWPLPAPDATGDKEDRGRVLVVGGSREIPGAIVLAARAALRSGAGKLQVGTTAGVAAHVAAALPEARVLALPETPSGGIAPAAVDMLRESVERADALLLGPGMIEEESDAAFALRLLDRYTGRCVLDANVIPMCLKAGYARPAAMPELVLTPHAGELAGGIGIARDQIEGTPERWARSTAERVDGVVALKGATTFIAAPRAPLYVNRGSNAGLATSGSGDVLAGIVAGLLARGATGVQAAAWGVYIHALAGARLARQVGPLGYLARELPEQVPAILQDLAPGAPYRRGTMWTRR